jgi:hypothetical protein
MAPQPLPPQADADLPPPPRGGRRGDAFDPNQNPNAAGAPRTLGARGTIAAAPPLDEQSDEPPNVGAPGGRQAGAPLDLGIMSEEAAHHSGRAACAARPQPECDRHADGDGTVEHAEG